MFQGVFKRLLPAALAVLLLAVLVGPSGSAVEAAVESRTVTKIITIPAAAFQPESDFIDFTNGGYGLWVDSGSGFFTAPVFFESRDVTVNDFTLFALDDNTTYDVQVWLFRSTPWTGYRRQMGVVRSNGASALPRNFTQTSLNPRNVTGSFGPYLTLNLPSSTDLSFYAVRINYTYTP